MGGWKVTRGAFVVLLFTVRRILLMAGQYVPVAQESAIVSQRQGKGYRVDIGSAHMASLDGLAFKLKGTNLI